MVTRTSSDWLRERRFQKRDGWSSKNAKQSIEKRDVIGCASVDLKNGPKTLSWPPLGLAAQASISKNGQNTAKLATVGIELTDTFEHSEIFNWRF